MIDRDPAKFISGSRLKTASKEDTCGGAGESLSSPLSPPDTPHNVIREGSSRVRVGRDPRSS